MEKREFILRVAGLVLVFFSGIAYGQGEPAGGEVTTVGKVDLSKYIGTWYEIARLPNSFQRQCARRTTATYSLRSDGRVEVLNRCVESDGSVSEAKGVARIVDTTTCAKLEVSFVRFLGIQLFWGDYWIIGLDSNYSYAVVGTPSRKYAWILSRTPVLSPADKSAALHILQSQGFKIENLLYTDQSE